MRNLIITALAIAAVASITLTTRAADGDKPDAKANWMKYCKGCHGETGKGDTRLGKTHKVRDYSDAKVQESLKDEDAFKAIKEGFKQGDHEVMKPLAEKMSDDEIKALVKHLRSLKQ